MALRLVISMISVVDRRDIMIPRQLGEKRFRSESGFCLIFSMHGR